MKDLIRLKRKRMRFNPPNLLLSIALLVKEALPLLKGMLRINVRLVTKDKNFYLIMKRSKV